MHLLLEWAQLKFGEIMHLLVEWAQSKLWEDIQSEFWNITRPKLDQLLFRHLEITMK